MNLLSRALAVGLLLVLAGCDSLSGAADRWREKLADREEPQVRDYAASPRATYEAVRVVADQMGFRFQRGGPAQGQFEAVSGVGLGDVPGSARQISLRVRLAATPDGGTEVKVVLKEIKEADSANRAGVATETPLRDTPLYDTFLRSVQRVLAAKQAG